MSRKKRYEARKPSLYGAEVEIFDHSTGFKLIANFGDFLNYQYLSDHIERLPTYVFQDVFALEKTHEQQLEANILNTEVMEERLLVHCTHNSEVSDAVQAQCRQTIFSLVRKFSQTLYSQWDHHSAPLCHESEQQMIDYLSRRTFISRVVHSNLSRD
tara:strand:- start:4905 stop:5375 length:471 start_codon:yes stop_codon:yes gene_type:complete